MSPLSHTKGWATIYIWSMFCIDVESGFLAKVLRGGKVEGLVVALSGLRELSVEDEEIEEVCRLLRELVRGYGWLAT